MTATDAVPEFLTVRELAELLRIKERKVYDLAAAGQVPCSRATGKLLFPEAEIRAWIEGTRTGPAPATPKPAVFLGSHDPLLEWAIRQSECQLAMLFDGSSDGLKRFGCGEGLATGLHIHDRKTDEWNVPRVSTDCAEMDAVLLSWAKRQRGLVIRAEHADAANSLHDLRGMRFAARQAGSGTDLRLRDMLAEADIREDEIDFTDPVRSEADAVLAVAQGEADAAFGLAALAVPFGLSFVPLIEERFDILVDRRAYFDKPFQTLLAFCRGPDFAARASSMAGYDLSGLGDVRWSA